jgi:hypothetical protein
VSRRERETPARTEVSDQRRQGSSSAAIVMGRGDNIGTQPGSALARLAEHEGRQDSVVVYPITLLRDPVASPILVENVTPITFNPDPTGPDVYVAWWNNKRFALRAGGLRRLGSAAGLKWGRSEFQYPPTDRGHKRVLATACASILLPNGEHYWIYQSFGIDTAVLEEKWLEEYLRKNTPRAEAQQQTRTRVLQMKEKYEREAETKAMSRCMRAVLNIGQDYEPSAFRKTWWIPSLVVRPNLNDPRELERVLVEGRRAVSDIYGLPSGSEVEDETWPAQPWAPPKVAGDGSSERAAGATAQTSEDGEAGQQRAPAGKDPSTEGEASTARPGPDSRSGGEPGGEPSQSSRARAGAGPTALAASQDTGTEAQSPPDEPDAPAEDPIIEIPGQYKGERVSVVAELNPNWLKGVIANMRPSRRRDLYQAWISHWEPTLPTP